MSRSLIDLAPPQERAILVGAPVKRSNARHHVQEHLDELARLADTAGAVVVGTLTQQLDRPDPSTYIGRGKVEELKQLITEKEATLIIFDDELSPAQGKNLEGELGKRTIDRAELILDIFAVRARSAEARMQVELAQLEYSLPRLVRMWTHLEKFRGGIGVRGPGETQLETDRRLVGHRIRLLKERLADVAKSREVQRGGRTGAFKAALVGYTNAGKSSILRAISRSSEVFVEDRLFATLDPLTREVDLGEHQSVLLTDTVGFIRKLPHHLVASFRATLEEVREADLLFHVIDASHPSWEEQRLVVDEVLADLGVAETPTRYVFNKMDALPLEQREALRARIENLAPGSIFVSAREEERGAAGLEPMRTVLRDALRARRPEVALMIPMTHGKLLAEVHRMGEVLSSEADEEEGVMRITGRFEPAALARLERDGAVRR
ncbi:GTPase HflX [Pseudogemmatithrix spongiicola]|uniref:GTPase HflX n=1 Tax=Pseudogemmatithrix spongiicola TaxID=3062599 RepID=A0AA49JV60_9BACT|nr:GTPase HflX [Gemmatimonadaceae bacterium 'strain 138']WKW15407.1 GTPase HflX [Gemmatimonadaceae bacterium 'strain 318']